MAMPYMADVVQGQSSPFCLQGLLAASTGQHSRMLERQLVMPRYSFSCGNATITQWEVLLHTHGGGMQQQQLAAHTTRMEFQVWRPNRRQGKYCLVGGNSETEGVVLVQDRIGRNKVKLMMKIKDPLHRISVLPGDIVGLFFLGAQGVELQYRQSREARTYQANLPSPLLEKFSTDIAREPTFRRTIMALPILTVKMENRREGS